MNSKSWSVIILCLAIALCSGTALGQVMGQPQAAPNIVEEVKVITYTIKPGDTLWDLAGQFYNKPWEWPQIWELNPYIEDPHWIYPDDTLQIRTVKLVYQTTGQEVGPLVQRPKLPTIYIEELPGFDNTFAYKTAANRIDFLSDETLKGSGEIIEDIDNHWLLSEMDWVWFDYDQDANLQIGDRLTIFRVGDRVKGARLIDVVGEIEVIDAVRKESRDRLVYKGAIRNSLSEIGPGDRLMKYDDRPLRITLKKTDKDISGEIIHLEVQKTIEGEMGIVFIDVGTEDGVEVGNSFSIYRESAHNKRLVPDYYIGNIIVIKVENRFATAVITNSLLDIQDGDRIISDRL